MGEGMALMQSESDDWPGCSVWPWVKHYIACSCGMVWGPIFLDSFSVSFLSYEVVRSHGVCWVQPSWHGGACFVFLCVDVKLSRPDTLLWRRVKEKARWDMAWLQWPHSTLCPPPIQHFTFLQWKISGRCAIVSLSSWFKCSMLHPGHLCLLSNNRGGFWEVCRRPGVKGMSNVMRRFPWGWREHVEDVMGGGGREGWAVGRASLFYAPIRVILCLFIEHPCGKVLSLPSEYSAVNSGNLAFPMFSSCSYLSSFGDFPDL